jgi:hypothetical protein
MTLDEAQQAVPPPAGMKYETYALPTGFSKEFTATKWQTKGEGIGLILYKDRVAGAVYELEGATDERRQELVTLQTEANQSPIAPLRDLPSGPITGAHGSYWFWSSRPQDYSPDNSTNQITSGTSGQPAKKDNPDEQLLMICDTNIQPNKLNVTVAIGTYAIMKALNMTPGLASSDLRAADKLLERPPTNPANSSNRQGA